MGELEDGEDPGVAVSRVLQTRVGLEAPQVVDVGKVTHVFSHRRLSCQVYLVELESPCTVAPGEGYQAARWVGDLDRVAWSVLGQKLVRCAGVPALLESATK